MKLPKMYAPVVIRFSSLRRGFGVNYGVILDIDTIVDRKCRRVLCDDGWRWQIVDGDRLARWEYGDVETDMEILNDEGSELEYEFVRGAS